mgnify:CR=1 FL=1
MVLSGAITYSKKSSFNTTPSQRGRRGCDDSVASSSGSGSLLALTFLPLGRCQSGRELPFPTELLLTEGEDGEGRGYNGPAAVDESRRAVVS